MDLRLTREHLAEADRHVAISDRHIARQIEIINDLKRSGCPTDLAVDVLHTYRMLRATHVAHRDLIRRELEQ
ncbi:MULTISPECIES: hypothetical protein [unclassified Bradyrhizobium]|uniref:hypothetical protein n=1 Tax=unclassified Bradyrhizobium TaxID=2631580 RepID=UPI00247AEA01|nr:MULTISPECIES: hypothetical protein [unclassified Bradyrhizobium]WGR68485.1 hypothetical protein MTX24_23960 [Bradyrhizobium sp. ISRA426]WGR80540.1 hypothetical protein MTX21_09075 [Bradyrhizobium sp. ISRA430]WGR83725.1 hypothetical protein MTX25_23640 [Bradyrhizobium sp. ISRA432]